MTSGPAINFQPSAPALCMKAGPSCLSPAHPVKAGKQAGNTGRFNGPQKEAFISNSQELAHNTQLSPRGHNRVGLSYDSSLFDTIPFGASFPFLYHSPHSSAPVTGTTSQRTSVHTNPSQSLLLEHKLKHVKNSKLG